MAQTIPHCVNHPKVETRVSCSSCGDPICPRCMRQAAVGQKCPRCAKVPRTALALGKPIHYVKAGGAGLALAVAGGLLLSFIRGGFGYGTILLPGLLGFGVGRVVSWGAQRQTHRRFEIMAVSLGVLGGVLAGDGLKVVNQPFRLLGVVAAGYFAWRGLHR